MFALVWRFFPGPVWVRIFALLALAVVLVWALITFVYPWATAIIPQPESTIDGT